MIRLHISITDSDEPTNQCTLDEALDAGSTLEVAEKIVANLRVAVHGAKVANIAAPTLIADSPVEDVIVRLLRELDRSKILIKTWDRANFVSPKIAFIKAIRAVSGLGLRE